MAVQISVKITGLDNIQRGVRTFAKALLGIGKRHLRRALERGRRTATGDYPRGAYSGYSVPPPPQSGYARTGTYGRAFDIVESGLTVRLEGRAISPRGQDYTALVGGYADASGQAGIHRGRWPLIARAVEAELAPLSAEMDAELSDVLRQEGIGL